MKTAGLVKTESLLFASEGTEERLRTFGLTITMADSDRRQIAVSIVAQSPVSMLIVFLVS